MWSRRNWVFSQSKVKDKSLELLSVLLEKFRDLEKLISRDTLWLSTNYLIKCTVLMVKCTESKYILQKDCKCTITGCIFLLEEPFFLLHWQMCYSINWQYLHMIIFQYVGFIGESLEKAKSIFFIWAVKSIYYIIKLK